MPFSAVCLIAFACVIAQFRTHQNVERNKQRTRERMRLQRERMRLQRERLRQLQRVKSLQLHAEAEKQAQIENVVRVVKLTHSLGLDVWRNAAHPTRCHNVNDNEYEAMCHYVSYVLTRNLGWANQPPNEMMFVGIPTNSGLMPLFEGVNRSRFRFLRVVNKTDPNMQVTYCAIAVPASGNNGTLHIVLPHKESSW